MPVLWCHCIKKFHNSVAYFSGYPITRLHIFVYISWIKNKNNKNQMSVPMKKELSQDSVARLTCALPLNLSKSMTHDLDLKVAQVDCDGTA